MKELSAARILAASITGAVAAWTGQVWPLVLMVMAAMMLDYFTGMLAAAYNREWESKKGRKGIIRKVSLLFTFALGLLLDTSIPFLVTKGFGVALPVNLPFGMIVAAWIVINEGISMLENVCRINPEAAPKFLVKLLKSMQQEIEQQGADSNKGEGGGQ